MSRRTRKPPRACVKCGSLTGRDSGPGTNPVRCDGSKYGSPGPHCWSCFRSVVSAAKREGRTEAKPTVQPTRAISQTQAQWIEMVAAERIEVPKRTAIVRAAKEEKARRIGWNDLTPEELDRILPRQEAMN